MRINKRFFLPALILASGSLYAGSAFSTDTPRDLRGTEIRQGTVKWEWAPVADAVNYEVTINGNSVGRTLDTKFYSYDLPAGIVDMYVQAVNDEGDISEKTLSARISVSESYINGSYGRSTLVDDSGSSSRAIGSSSVSSNANVVQGLSSSEFSGNDVRWEWNSADGAAQYEVTVDGVVVGITNDTFWVSEDLWRGTHSLTVRAISASGAKTDQSATHKIDVTGNGSGAAGSSSESVADFSPPPVQNVESSNGGGDENAANVQSLIDPASYNYPETTSKEGYELVFSDEFNGTALNPFRWHTQLRWDGDWNGERYEYRVVNGEDQFYVNTLGPDQAHVDKFSSVYDPFKFNGSTLSIQSIVNPLKNRDKTRSFGDLEQMSSQQQFLSGVIATHDKFHQKHGYFEARIKIPSHEGTFPAFWMFHQNRSWEGTHRTEIDIMENLGHAPHYIYNSFHYFDNVSATYSGDHNFIKPRPSGQVFTGTDFSEDFHVYAVEWTQSKIVWKIDGRQVSEVNNDQASYEDLYLKLNLALGGNWTNFPTNAGGLGRPSDQRWPTSEDVANFQNPKLEIDYVRAYRLK